MSLVLKQKDDRCPTCGRVIKKNGFDKQGRQLYRCQYCVRTHGSARHINLFPKLTMTPHRVEILRLAAQGLTHYEIGEQVFVTPSTVKNTLTDIHHILEAKNTAHAIFLACKKGLI